MPEETYPAYHDTSRTAYESTPLHTCTCGEHHPHPPGTASHQETCTSPLKFGDTCCCGSGPAAGGSQHRCGHSRKCR